VWHADGLLGVWARQLFRGGYETGPPRGCSVAPPERVGSSAYERYFNTLGSPGSALFNRTNGRPVQMVDKDMRAALVLDFRDRDPAGWHPEQRGRNIAGRRDHGSPVVFLRRTGSIFS